MRQILATLFCVIAFAGDALLCLPHAAAQQISVTELSDIDFGRATPTGGLLRADIRLCVALDQASQYRVQAWGEEYGGDFFLISGPYRLPYTVGFTDRRRARGFQELLPRQPLTGLRVRGNTNGVCRRSNAGLRVELPAIPLTSTPSGLYRATLTLMVSPE